MITRKQLKAEIDTLDEAKIEVWHCMIQVLLDESSFLRDKYR
jgi:hypothetical protein